MSDKPFWSEKGQEIVIDEIGMKIHFDKASYALEGDDTIRHSAYLSATPEGGKTENILIETVNRIRSEEKINDYFIILEQCNGLDSCQLRVVKANPPHSDQPLEIILSTEKKTYMPYEPIVLGYSIKNNGAKPVTIFNRPMIETKMDTGAKGFQVYLDDYAQLEQPQYGQKYTRADYATILPGQAIKGQLVYKLIEHSHLGSSVPAAVSFQYVLQRSNGENYYIFQSNNTPIKALADTLKSNEHTVQIIRNPIPENAAFDNEYATKLAELFVHVHGFTKYPPLVPLRKIYMEFNDKRTRETVEKRKGTVHPNAATTVFTLDEGPVTKWNVLFTRTDNNKKAKVISVDHSGTLRIEDDVMIETFIEENTQIKVMGRRHIITHSGTPRYSFFTIVNPLAEYIQAELKKLTLLRDEKAIPLEPRNIRIQGSSEENKGLAFRVDGETALTLEAGFVIPEDISGPWNIEAVFETPKGEKKAVSKVSFGFRDPVRRR